MNIKIYQINVNRDKNNVKHESLQNLEKYHGTSKIDSGIYDRVFMGDVDCNDLEEVYQMFNIEGHPLHRGGQMNVSDIVVVEGNVHNLVGKIRFYNSSSKYEECSYTDNLKFKKAIAEAVTDGRTIEVDKLEGQNIPAIESGAYFCDRIGFKKVDFDESAAQAPNNLMSVVYVEPNRKPFVSEIEHTLESEQKAVGGLIELVYNDDETAIVCNEEGKLKGMEGNRRIGNGSSIIAGPFFIVGLTEGDFRSLTESEVMKYMDKFEEPEEISQEEVEADMGFTFIPM